MKREEIADLMAFVVVAEERSFTRAAARLSMAQSALSQIGHCCKVSDEAAFCLIQRPYISKTLLTRRISPRG
ncbi:LysR family transcriptional regulator, partial [Escherichia coli]